MSRLRPFQVEALEALKASPHVICVSPTGSGKTRIIAELLRAGERVLLFTPLAALARQQERSLRSRNVAIVNPESKRLPRILRELRPTIVAIDECHCYCEWGDTFRPAFQEIPFWIRKLGHPRSLWLTATLPREYELRIRSALPGPCTRIGGFQFPANLHLRVVNSPWHARTRLVCSLQRIHQSAGIVFTRTRQASEQLQKLLPHSVAYHAGLSHEERLAIENQLLDGDAPRVVVATSAFGLGMHFPRLKWAALWQPPHSLLALAQLAGRVGRDPKSPAFVTALWEPADFWTDLRVDHSQAAALLSFHENSQVCRQLHLAKSLGESSAGSSQSPCGRCDICALSYNAYKSSHC